MIDWTALRRLAEQHGRPPRILDVACGTGVLLREILARLPDADAYGVDGSAGMLAEARRTLRGRRQVHLVQTELGSGANAGLPCLPRYFDLITCTNTLHDIRKPVTLLSDLHLLLADDGQLVVEDFARRMPPFPWPLFAWLIGRVEGSPVRAYTLAEAQGLCNQAGLHVTGGRAFSVDRLWRAWVVRAKQYARPDSPDP